MPGNYRKPTDKNHKEIPFNIQVEEKEYSGTIAEAGEPLAFGVPSTFIVRIPGKPRMTLSVYRGEWQLPGATETLAKSLGKWVENYYK